MLLSRVSEGATEKKRSERIHTLGPQPCFVERGRSGLLPHTSRMGHGNRRSPGVSATGAETLWSARVPAAVLFALLLSTFSSAIDQKKGKSETRRSKSPNYSAHGNFAKKGTGLYPGICLLDVWWESCCSGAHFAHVWLCSCCGLCIITLAKSVQRSFAFPHY